MNDLEANITTLLDGATAFIRSSVESTFKPVAYYDDQLDCLRVIVRDCSVTENRINEHLTIAEDNNPETAADRYVGFTVKEVRRFIRSTKSVEISSVLEQMLKRICIFDKTRIE